MMQVFKIDPIYPNLLVSYSKLINVNQNKAALKPNHQIIHHY